MRNSFEANISVGVSVLKTEINGFYSNNLVNIKFAETRTAKIDPKVFTCFKLRFLTCCTVKSRKVRSFLTAITDLGPLQPIEVPRPPFSLTTTSLWSICRISSLEGCWRAL